MIDTQQNSKQLGTLRYEPLQITNCDDVLIGENVSFSIVYMVHYKLTSAKIWTSQDFCAYAQSSQQDMHTQIQAWKETIVDTFVAEKLAEGCIVEVYKETSVTNKTTEREL